ncbi:1-deoxy-D-xylulose-5-phosphate synthase [uncultured archaeon]|nr:1-deoxy-D-xylulose-5-phosphate synthase [uncultured archaeon]
MKTTKEGFEEGLEELSKIKEVIALSTSFKKFAEKHPNKYFKTADAGIAAGMAHEGKTPFVTTVGLGKNWQQIKEICTNNENVKIIDLDEELEDLAIARILPNIKVIIPADYHEAKKATIAAGTTKGPYYIKLLTEKASITEKTAFTVGRMEIMRAGKDCTIISNGPALQNAMMAAEKLSKQEVECTVLDSHTIQPIDKHALIASARLTGCIVATDRILGSAIAETICQNYPVPVRITTPDNIIAEVKNAVMLKCEVCGEIVEEHGKKLQLELRPELYFRLHRGGIIKSIPGLHKALLNMNEETFTYHCNTNKNDFSIWVKEAFNEPILAKNLDKVHTKLGMMLELTRWLK